MIISNNDIVEILVERSSFGDVYLKVTGQDIIDKFHNKEAPKKTKRVRDGVFDGRGVAHLHRALCNFGIHTSGKTVNLEKMAYNVWYDLDWHQDDIFSDKTIEHLKGIRKILSGGDAFVQEAITSATTGDLFNMISEILVVNELAEKGETK